MFKRIVSLFLVAVMLSANAAPISAEMMDAALGQELVIVTGMNDEEPQTPSEEPTAEPVEEPTEEPKQEPTKEPVQVTSEEPTQEPVVEPTEEPVVEPTEEPVVEPTEEPVVEPTEEPVVEPTEEPVVEPTEEPVVEPTEEPVVEPTEEPVVEPTEEPVVEPTEEPVVEPTEEPVVEPTEEPVVEPTEEPVVEPTEEPVVEPTEEPVVEPTEEPVVEPSEEPVVEPTEEPTDGPADEAEPVAELTLSLSTSSRYAVANDDAIALSASIAGGSAPYTLKLNVIKDGESVYEAVLGETAEAEVYYTYLPTLWGEYSVKLTVTDALGSTVSDSVTVPVAVNEGESREHWEATLKNVELTGDWRVDIVNIARTQLGYTESEKNFIIDEAGVRHGYTRYGEWMGSSFGEWCGMFVAFCVRYAGIGSAFPVDAHVGQFADALGGALETDTLAYVPSAGDLIFFDWDGDNEPDHMGIVEAVNQDSFTVHTIQGNARAAVRRVDYSLGDSQIYAYGNTAKLMEAAGLDVSGEPEIGEEEVKSELTVIGQAKTTASGVNVRTKPAGDIVATQIANTGTVVDVYGVENVNGEDWVQIKTGSTMGYIVSRFLEMIPEATEEPTVQPTEEPTAQLTEEPTAQPTVDPTEEPAAEPTVEPTEEPTVEPTAEPEEEDEEFFFDKEATPTATPAPEMTEEPAVEPTVEPTEEPAAEPTEEPAAEPTTTPEPDEEFFFGDEVIPTATPAPEMTEEPAVEPSVEPTVEPSVEPTVEPTEEPVEACTCVDAEGVRLCAEDCACECHVAEEPVVEPSVEPTVDPTEEPVEACTCVDAEGVRLCAEDCACECHVTEVPVIEPTEEPVVDREAELTETQISTPEVVGIWEEGWYIENEPMTFHITTSLDAEKLEMRSGDEVLDTWMADQAEIVEYANCKEWIVEYTFSSFGNYGLWYRVYNADGAFGNYSPDPVVIKRPQVIGIWEDGWHIENEPMTFHITTNLDVEKLEMRAGDQILGTWLAEDTEIIEYATCKEWLVEYTFDSFGTYGLWYRAYEADGTYGNYSPDPVVIKRPQVIGIWADGWYIENDLMTFHITTNLDVEKLEMRAGDQILGTWLAEDTEIIEYATCKEWLVEYTFDSFGTYGLWYRAYETDGTYANYSPDPVVIKRPQVIGIWEDGWHVENEPMTFHITTNLDIEKLEMRAGDQIMGTWLAEEAEIIEYATCKEWIVEYTFDSFGTYGLWYRAHEADGTYGNYSPDPVVIKRPQVIDIWADGWYIENDLMTFHITTNLDVEKLEVRWGDQILGTWLAEETEIIEYATCKEWLVEYTFDSYGTYGLWYRAHEADGTYGNYSPDPIIINRPHVIDVWEEGLYVEKEPMTFHITTNLAMEKIELRWGDEILETWLAAEEEIIEYPTCKEWIVQYTFDNYGSYKPWYRAYAADDTYGNYSTEELLVIAPAAPAAPAIATAELTSANEVTLTWEAVDGADGYIVKMAAEEDGEYAEVADVTDLTAVISDLIEGTHFFKLYAYRNIEIYNEEGMTIEKLLSEASEVASMIIAPAAPVAPAAPAIATAELTGENEATLTWEAVDGADGYIVKMATEEAGEYAEAADVAELTAVITDLAVGTTYFKLYAYKNVEVTTEEGTTTEKLLSEASEIVTLTIEETGDLAAPVVEATKTENSITLTWAAVEGASSYNVYMDKGEGMTLCERADATLTTETFADLAAGAYKFKVAAVKEDGVESVNFAETEEIVIMDTNLVLTAVQEGYDVVLSWNALFGAASYSVYEASDYVELTDEAYELLISDMTDTTLVVGKPMANKLFSYKVVAYTAEGEAFATAVTEFTREFFGPAAPETVTVDQNDESVTVTWSAVEGVLEYEVYVVEGADGGETVYAARVEGTELELDTLEAGLNYTVYVASVAFEGDFAGDPGELRSGANFDRIGYMVEETEGGVSVTGYIGDKTELAIPQTIGGKTVVAIAKEAFMNCDELVSVVVPDTVTTMGTDVFANCTALETAELSAALDEVPARTFEGCTSLTSVTIADATEIIGERAFAGCEALEDMICK